MEKRVLKRPRGTYKVTPEMLAHMLKHLPTVGSLRDLATITGTRLDAVRQAVAPFLATMKANGTHPKCGCGKDRFHPYGCVDRERKARYSTPIRGRSAEDALAAVAKRGPIIDAIMTGDPYSAIEQRLNLPHKSARKYLIHLTPDQLAQRKRLERDRAEPVGNKRPFGDALYARIAAAVPDWVSGPTRDDIISEMYLATQEGALRLADIEANARRFTMAAVAMWESKFSPRSIDAPMFDDGKRTLADMIPDPAALAAFEALDDMRVGRGCNAMGGC